MEGRDESRALGLAWPRGEKEEMGFGVDLEMLKYKRLRHWSGAARLRHWRAQAHRSPA